MRDVLRNQKSSQTAYVKVDIMTKEGEDGQEGFLFALLTLPAGREVMLLADEKAAYDQDRAGFEKFIGAAREEALKLNADFEVCFNLDDEFPQPG